MHLAALALLLGVGAGGFVHADGGAISKDTFKAAEQRIEAQAKAKRQACARLKGHAQEVCALQAKGWEKVAKAHLQAQHEPGPEAEKEAKFARADADYDVAKLRCKALKDRAQDACVKRAKHDREAAIRLAKVEKVEEVQERKREAKAEESRQKPASAPRKS